MAVNKPLLIVGGIALLILLTMKSSKAFGAPTKSAILRGKDPLGDGAFGASRSGGTRSHKGIDYKAAPGEPIYAPIAGTVTRYPKPYADDPNYSGIEIKNKSHIVKMFYLSPSVPVGTYVQKGQKIGTAQNISAKHGTAMTNHVHFEMYTAGGTLINPTNMMPGVTLNYSLVLKKGVYNSPEVMELQRLLGIGIDGDFGPMTEAALVAQMGVKQIRLKDI